MNLAIPYPFRLENWNLGEFGLKNGALLAMDRSKNTVLNDFTLFMHEGVFIDGRIQGRCCFYLAKFRVSMAGFLGMEGLLVILFWAILFYQCIKSSNKFCCFLRISVL